MPETTLHQPKDYKALMLSSTFTDLREHRERAIQAIHKLGYMARVMEHSGAQAEADVIDTSLAMVRDAAAYIGVISLKYGQTPFDAKRNPNRLSITELEFNEAMGLGRPIVLFIMGEDHPVKKADIESDPDKLRKLNEFRERAKHMRRDSEVHRVYEMFDSVEQFSTAAATAIGNLVRYLERSAPTTNAENGQKPHHVISNIPINIPFHFVGREQDVAAIDRVLDVGDGRAAITALHGLRGVGKTTLAAAYAERHRDKYRATWWIKAETESTMRADLVGLGVQLAWVAADASEEKAVNAILEQLRTGGHGILLIYDNAIGPKELAKFLPRSTGARIIITSNAPNWSAVAGPVGIKVWPKEVGADFLMARSGRAAERDAALGLSEVLGGLPLAHEQAAAYCERIGISLADYLKRFEGKTSLMLDYTHDASREYHDGLTVAKTFALAIDEAAKLHPAAEPLVVYAALLAPEPIPLYLFSEASEKFGESFASAIVDGGLDEAIAALRAFALIDREFIPDERDPSIATECIRLHRLVRQVAATRYGEGARAEMLRQLITAMEKVLPKKVVDDPNTWPRVRRLHGVTLALVDHEVALPAGAEKEASHLLDRLAQYNYLVLAAYDQARLLLEHALAIDEEVFGSEHSNTAASLNNLSAVLEAQDDFEGSRPLKERALAICEKVHGADHSITATSLNNLGFLLSSQKDYEGALNYFERALEIKEKDLGANHIETAVCLNNVGSVMREQGDFVGARRNLERSLAIREEKLGLDHLETAVTLSNLGSLSAMEGDFVAARKLHQSAMDIREKVLGSNHPDLATSLDGLGYALISLGSPAEAWPLIYRGLSIYERIFGHNHRRTQGAARSAADALDEFGKAEEARALRNKYKISTEAGS